MATRGWARTVAGAPGARRCGARALRTLVGAGLGVALLACGGGGVNPQLNAFAFPQPPVWDWTPGLGWLENGQPTTGTLECGLATNPLGGGTVVTPTFNRRLIGPTLRIRPGDTFDIEVCNRFPVNPAGQRAGPTGAFPHDRFTTNLHTHGLTTHPEGISDNVLRRMEPGTRNAVRVCIPPYHPSGTMWYHPHKHGSVTWQLMGGMAGFLIVEGGPGTLDAVPEIAAARDYVMGFAGIRVDAQGQVPWVDTAATAFAGGSKGLWDTFTGTTLHATTNGRVNPTLFMRPGEVQRWRFLNAFAGESLALTLDQHALRVISLDGLTMPNMITLLPGTPCVLGAGNRADVLVKAGLPGVYVLRAIDPALGSYSITPQGIEPAPRRARIGGTIPTPAWPLSLATIVVTGVPQPMSLPKGPLPVADDLRTPCMMATRPTVSRRVEFDICPNPPQPIASPYTLATCTEYRTRYGAAYWGGTVFNNLLMMLDADDHGIWEKEGLFDHDKPLFSYPGDTPMFGGALEEWTVINRTPSDHPFHIHVNPFLVTHINGVVLPVPEWRDTILVPAQTTTGTTTVNGSVTFRTHYDPNYLGTFVMHCHILTHEDVGMMQALEVVEGRGDVCGPHPLACEPELIPFALVEPTTCR